MAMPWNVGTRSLRRPSTREWVWREPQRQGSVAEADIVHRHARAAPRTREPVQRGEVECVERPHRYWERCERTIEDEWRELDEAHSREEPVRRIAMRRDEVPGIQPDPGFVGQEPTREEGFVPEPGCGIRSSPSSSARTTRYRHGSSIASVALELIKEGPGGRNGASLGKRRARRAGRLDEPAPHRLGEMDVGEPLVLRPERGDSAIPERAASIAHSPLPVDPPARVVSATVPGRDLSPEEP